MYKVLIVDDELLVRTHIKATIDWEANGCMISGEATNGLEALSILEQESVDIVLSDIRMPLMDGLKLSYELREKHPETKLIVLSNYDDFEYVKCTLKNGAVDYILKHTISAETLVTALDRAKTLIAENRASRQTSAVEVKNINNLLALKEKFVLQLLTGVYREENEIQMHLKMFDIKIKARNTTAIAMVIDNYKLDTDKSGLKDIALLDFAIINILEEILNEFGNGIISHISNEKYIIILSFENSSRIPENERVTYKLLDRISGCLQEFINISVSFSIGNMVDSIGDIGKSYEAAERQLSDKFYKGIKCILTPKEESMTQDIITGLNLETEKELKASLNQLDKKNVLSNLDKVFNSIESSKLSLSSSQVIFADLLSILNRMCKENYLELSSLYSLKEAPYSILAKFETFVEIRKWITDLYLSLIDLLASHKDKQYSEYVGRTLNFINSHYSENISLGSAASFINVSSTYLSTLFKSEVGTGFSDYLINFRLEKAKEMLEDGKTDIKEIVENCGFSDYAYFFKIFKKKMGITPKNYVRQQHYS